MISCYAFFSPETRNPHRANLPSELMYFSGDCTSQSTIDRIAQAFIDLLGMSNYKDACDQSDQCTIENVVVTCGSSSGRRRRRSVDEAKYHNRLQRSPHRAEREEMKWNTMQSRHNEPLASPQTRQRRSVLYWEFFISFEFSIEIHYEAGVDSFDATLDSENRMIEFAEVVFADISGGTIPPLNVSGLEMELDESSPTYGYAEITCEPGYIANNDDYVCGKYKHVQIH